MTHKAFLSIINGLISLEINIFMGKNYPEQHAIKTGKILNCQLCNSQKLCLILDLGEQPLSDSMRTEKMLSQPESKYPLRFCRCEDCGLAQIDYCVDPGTIYHLAYPYRSGATKELLEYFKGQAELLIQKYKLNSKSLVVDIGSNDGSFLENFIKQGVKVLGVEPTDAAKTANQNGIETIQGFFNQEVAENIVSKQGKAYLVTSAMVLERASELGEVLSGVETLLADGGAFVFETHYLFKIIQGGQFDAIYHEHLRTFSLTALIKFFEFYDFTIVDVENGFSFRGNIKVTAVKGKNQPTSANIAKFLKQEAEAGLNKPETYVNFAQRVKKSKEDFIGLMEKIKAEGKTLAANSCPARCVVLLNYYNVGPEAVAYIAEHPTSGKLGMYLPGKHIVVVNNQKLIDEQPDYVVLLAWYYAEPIMKALKQRGVKSDFIIPLPDLRVVKNLEI